MSVALRKFMMACLVLAFVSQTAMVYADGTADERGTLSGPAVLGREIWHRNNCQSCHQIYGFGGFLGPDLTNATSRVNRERLDSILTDGAKQMPAFGMSPTEIDAIEAYFGVLNRTGVGQLRPRIGLSQADVLGMIDAHRAENPMAPEALRGFDLFSARCSSCHTPFKATPLGPYLAADLSTVARRFDRTELAQILVDGRIDRGMPPTGLEPSQRSDVIAFLLWLADQEPSLRPRSDAAEIDLGVPWFEFR